MKLIVLTGLLMMLATAAFAQQQSQGSKDQPVKAGFSTGEEFLAFCPADEPADQVSLSGAICIAYMRGYMDASATTEKILHSLMGDDFRWVYCITDAATPSVNLTIVRKWLTQHPDASRQSIAAIATAAFHDNFPCSQG
jgi:hypothetical protein